MLTLILWFSAIGCGLVAGLYFAFSGFIMRALGRIDLGAGINAMNAINKVILGSLFMPLFFGTTLASAVLAALALLRWDEPSAALMFTGGLVYVVGMFGVTLAFNVPLNNELASAAEVDDATAVWSRYLKHWTLWNHVRTVASTIAFSCFIAALLAV
ncbi:DUF1772 domain-containing protein [Billgrantia antri]|uniref:DUF1772 domain-containing protein n=1 Tax=Billgrantia antri TaxID=2846777 RepID=A0ABS6ZJ54_9GAMM|nr:anthrone oxygenase family protein [Halomonas antri]MBW6390099.1 DUF1772 domain-containing protein [Halomonas antri]